MKKNIFALDSRLEESAVNSDLVSATKKKSGEFNSATMSQPKLDVLANYAQDITNKAIRLIENGNIKAMPCVGSCQFCDFKGICLYDLKKGERAQKSMESFFKEGNDEV